MRVRPSHSSSKHLSTMPLHKPLPWIIPFHHRQRNLLPGKIPEQPPNNPAPIHRLGNQHPHTFIQPNRSLIKRLMMNRTQRQSVRDLTRSAKLLPFNMRSFKSYRGVIMSRRLLTHSYKLAEPAGGTADLEPYGSAGYQNLSHQRALPECFQESALQDQVFVLNQKRKVLFIKPACDVMFHKFFNGRLFATRGRTELSILQIPKPIPLKPPERHIRVMRLPLWAKAF